MAGTVLIWLAPIALLISLVALGIALVARRGARSPARRSDIITTVREGDVSLAVEQAAAKIADLEAAQRDTVAALERVVAQQKLTFSHAGVVRFDALNDLTGELSFALALLDDNKDGLVVTSITGRQQTRVYAKAVEGGTSAHALSDEERTAIARAMEKR